MTTSAKSREGKGKGCAHEHGGSEFLTCGEGNGRDRDRFERGGVAEGKSMSAPPKMWSVLIPLVVILMRWWSLTASSGNALTAVDCLLGAIWEPPGSRSREEIRRFRNKLSNGPIRALGFQSKGPDARGGQAGAAYNGQNGIVVCWPRRPWLG